MEQEQYNFDKSVDRRGTFCAKWERYAGRDIIPMWLADMDFVAAPPILEALRQRVEHGIFGYTLCEEVDDVVVRYMRTRWKCHVKESWITYLPGLEAGIQQATYLILGQNGTVALPYPIYPAFHSVSKSKGVSLCLIPMRFVGGRQVLDIDYLQQQANRNEVRLLHICNPHNPGGKVFSREELMRIGDICLRNNILLCSDEVHADIILDEGLEHVSVLGLDHPIARHCIVLQSPSKTFNLAGLNFACAIIPGHTLRRNFQKICKLSLPSHLNLFGIVAATAAWSGKCDLWRDSLVRHLRTNRNRLTQALENLPKVISHHQPATYLAWMDLRKLKVPHRQLIAFLESKGLGLSDGSLFGAPGYVRMNFACPKAKLEKAILRLQAACS